MRRESASPCNHGDIRSGQGLDQHHLHGGGQEHRSLQDPAGGQSYLDVIGPLGQPTHLDKVGKVICVGGGTGIAVLYPITRGLKQIGNHVFSVIGARSRTCSSWKTR